MTVTELRPTARELEWNDPHPLDNQCVFLDHRAAMRGAINVSADGGHEFLTVRMELPNGEHYTLALTRTAQLHLADAIEAANEKWNAS